MEYIHIKNIEKYHPGYIDRELKWAKLYFTSVQGDPEFEIIANETDKWRFVAMICLELKAQKPLPNTDEYWGKKFDIKTRPMSLTLQMLQKFIEVCREPLQPDEETCVLEGYIKKSNIKKSKTPVTGVTEYQEFEQTCIKLWNEFCNKYPILSKIITISDSRRKKLKLRYTSNNFRDFSSILTAIEKQPFLLGQNDRKWKIGFDWLIDNDHNHIKVIELTYLKEKPKTGIEKYEVKQ